MPYGRHIYAKASDIANATMCSYPHSDNALSQWKCVLRCCADCPCINLPDQETNKKHCTVHGIIPLKEKEICYMHKQESSSDKSTKICTRKELVMLETIIS